MNRNGSAQKVTPFSLRIFVVGGDPNGLRIVEKSNWVGQALRFKATHVGDIK